MNRIRPNGFTLLEVLIALLIFSLGLMGLAGLMVVSVKTNHSAYLRTQATFLAQGMADRMRANVLGLWNAKYDLASITTPPTKPAAITALGTVTDCVAASCAYDNVAKRDLELWKNQLFTFLPGPGAAIKCTAAAGSAPSTSWTLLPPYSGTCEIEIAWNESQLNSDGNAAPEIFDWVFQP
jgi:type IV pilus assembly protein PilV